MDRQRAQQAFDAYVAAYDPTNPRIALKVDHTLRVAQLCERIAASLLLPQEDINLAWLVGLPHDIGRFEQVRRFDTFNDAKSLSHAALGAEVLFEHGEDREPLVRAFLADGQHDQLIHTAVATHSAYRLPHDLDERTRMLCTILRDADKIDILKVNCICPIEDIYGVTDQDMRDSLLSPACQELFYEHRCLPRGVRRYPADIMLGHICFVWELVYPESLLIVREQGFLAQMLNRQWSVPETQVAFTAMAAHLRQARDI